MNRIWTRRRALLCALAIVLLTNAIALSGVALNRRGAPESSLVLSERELLFPGRYFDSDEDSAIEMQLFWRMKPSPSGVDVERFMSEPPGTHAFFEADWLSEKKLHELGFDIEGDVHRLLQRAPDPSSQQTIALPRLVFIVLEINGDAYRTTLRRAELAYARAAAARARAPNDTEAARIAASALDSLQYERNSASRLFVIDAGLERDALRAQYPDRTRFAVVRGKIGIRYGDGQRPARVLARVDTLYAERIALPNAFRDVAKRLQTARDGASPQSTEQRQFQSRFAARVVFGARLEPWIADFYALPIQRQR